MMKESATLHPRATARTPRMAAAALALGSNLGDRQAFLTLALQWLGELPRTTLRASSEFFETAAEGPVAQGPFLNAAAVLDTALPPRDLLHELQRLEFRAGRVRPRFRRHWGPRPLDLDILLYDQQILDETDLVLPHPRMHTRRFVLEPLAAIAPGWVHPLRGRSVAQMLDDPA